MIAVVIVAAGKGTRMGPDQDKLFMNVAGLPVVAHTWKQFDAAPGIDEIVLVIRAGMESAFQELAVQQKVQKPFRLVPGGKERQDSVWNGLEALSRETEIVLIQDAARPCTSQKLIHDCIEAARRNGAAVAAQPVVDTIKESLDGCHISSHLDRSRLWSVQTPQSFQVSVLLRALEQVRSRGLLITDDTAACELIGQKAVLVPSALPNPKVTVAADLPYIDLLLQKAQSLS
jgi:2-C-methyl-D-erythritol 4-phosphate cytidylyltransferase